MKSGYSSPGGGNPDNMWHMNIFYINYRNIRFFISIIIFKNPKKNSIINYLENYYKMGKIYIERGLYYN